MTTPPPDSPVASTVPIRSYSTQFFDSTATYSTSRVSLTANSSKSHKSLPATTHSNSFERLPATTHSNTWSSSERSDDNISPSTPTNTTATLLPLSSPPSSPVCQNFPLLSNTPHFSPSMSACQPHPLDTPLLQPTSHHYPGLHMPFISSQHPPQSGPHPPTTPLMSSQHFRQTATPSTEAAVSCIHVSVQLEPEQLSSPQSSLALSAAHITADHFAYSNPAGTKTEAPSVRIETLQDGHGKNATPPSSRARRMGHSRHLSLGHNVPEQLKKLSHSRNRSLGSIDVDYHTILPPATPAITISMTHGSVSNLSNNSTCGSEFSTESGFPKMSELPQLPPDPSVGYDFAQHFNLFSQYTSDMALEHCLERRSNEEKDTSVPPVWCMACKNKVVAVGCGNGHVEVRTINRLD